MWCQWQYRKGKNRKECYFVVWLFVFVSLKTPHSGPLGAGGAGGAAAPPETDFRGVLSTPPPLQKKIMGYYGILCQ